MPNPFDLRGPEFLLFYFVLGLVTLAGVRWLRRAREADALQRPLLNDYLQIAYLRGGVDEALRVATVNLINRGFIEVAGDWLRTVDAGASGRVPRPMERRILEKFQASDGAASIFRDGDLRAAAELECRPDLTRLGLLPDESRAAARTSLLMLALAVLGGTAGIRIVLALSRGRTNLLFLVAETIVFCFIAFKVARPHRTPAGDALLEDLRTLFAGLRARAASLVPGAQAGPDVALLAAVFGVDEIPSRFGFRGLFRRARTRESSWTSGCGFGGACGTSCGGGCGGGCGGCGA